MREGMPVDRSFCKQKPSGRRKMSLRDGHFQLEASRRQPFASQEGVGRLRLEGETAWGTADPYRRKQGRAPERLVGKPPATSS
jgi:hypothetical protein